MKIFLVLDVSPSMFGLDFARVEDGAVAAGVEG